MRKLIAGAALALIVTGAGSTAFAGEVGGNGEETPIVTRRVASSICAFNGLDDGSETGNPVVPGVVQSFGSLVAGEVKGTGAKELHLMILSDGPGVNCRGNLELGPEG